jgi:cytochrome c oxidase subunit 3
MPCAIPNLILIFLSFIPMLIADRAALKMKQNVVRISATIALLMMLAAIYLRFREFSALVFRWDDNAYASVCWAILGLHLMHLAVLCSEDGLMCAYIWIHGLDDKHARDIRVTAVYWYWVVAMWLISFFIVWISPRIM